MSTDQPMDFGYIEGAQCLVDSQERTWDAVELRDAARQSELKNTGWPIGIFLQSGDGAPIVTETGIQARINHTGTEQWEDYWRFRFDGAYYVARLFEEDFHPPSFQTSAGHPDRPLWLDIRIWRIAEVILHSASVYEALGVPPDEPYMLAVNHGGLEGREFWVSSSRWYLPRGRFSHVNESDWHREVTQDFVRASLGDLTVQVSRELFQRFDFADVSPAEIQRIVRDFSARRLI